MTHKKLFSAEMAFENLPNIDGESSKNLFRECMLAPNDFRPPTDDMRLSFEDEDFKVIKFSLEIELLSLNWWPCNALKWPWPPLLSVATVGNWSIKTWLGETIGIITNQSVELTGTAAEGMQKITEALLKGFRGETHIWFLIQERRQTICWNR